MDYIEAFRNLRTNNKYGRKSPHKAVLMLTVIELYEHNVLSENEIYYDDTLKSMFLKVWNRVLPDEPLFHPDAYLPFWYLQGDSFWHIVPVRGKEDILVLMRDTNIKPSEAKLNDCVKYAELDDDLYFLMTLPSGRSSLKRALLETYTNLSERQINRMAESVDNAIDYSASALSDYEKILSNGKDDKNIVSVETDNELVHQFRSLSEDLQIILNLQYFSFLKSHRNEREMFKEVCPTVYDLLEKIIHPVNQGDISPSFAFTYDNFLSDLKIALMSEEGSMDLIDKIGEAIDILRCNVFDRNVDKEIKAEPYIVEQEDPIAIDNQEDYLASKNKIQEIDESKDNRRGLPWSEEEEEIITQYFNQGVETTSIAEKVGRTEVAIKARLAKLGLIDYSYGQEEKSLVENNTRTQVEKEDDELRIINYSRKCSIVNKYGKTVFSDDGKIKKINGNYYRLLLKFTSFTVNPLHFNGVTWAKGGAIISAYPESELYRVLYNSRDYYKMIEDVDDNIIATRCQLKVEGVWYNYHGSLCNDVSPLGLKTEHKPKPYIDSTANANDSLYENRKQAVIQALRFFSTPATVKKIARTISRTAWGAAIKEDDVEVILITMPEVAYVNGLYLLRKGY